SRRDRIAEEQAVQDAARREVESLRARADAAVGLAEERLAQHGREVARLAEREATLADERHRVEAELAGAQETERRAAAALDEVRTADAQARDRLAGAE